MAPRSETTVDSGLRARKTAKVDDALAAPAASKNGEFTWQDVAAHNTPASQWVIIRGVVYDVTEWADRHPGGAELIQLHAGRECTDTFDSYHPFSQRADKILSKYAIGKLVGPTEFPTYKPDTGFYKECARRVDAYFKTNKLDPKAPFAGMWRMTIVFVLAALSYAGMNALIPGTSVLAMYAWAALFGVCQALPLLHVMHDSSHAAWSSSPTGWFLVGRGVFDWFAGGCMESWLNQHIVGHHIYTNVIGADPDLPVNFTSDVRRIVERQLLRPIYQFQHLYLPPLYGVLALKFRLQDIFETFIALTNGPIRVNPHPITSWVHLILAKSFWAFYRIYIPLAVLQVPSSTFWGAFLLAEFVTGWYLAFNFQVSHVSTECDYPNGDHAATTIEDEWAVSQVKSCVDYAHDSPFMTFLAGALNYQVTHHLFPGVSQYHYPAIAPIIKEVCKKYKIEYKVLPTFTVALKAHFRHLKEMGAQGKPVHFSRLQPVACMEIGEWSPENQPLSPAAMSEAATVDICKEHVSIADVESYAPVAEAPPSGAIPPRNAPDKWAVDLPRLLLSTNLTLEKFHLLKWQEIFRLSRILASPSFRRVRLAGDDHALYECFHRSFPHEMVAKARFTGVARAVLGVEGSAVLSQEAHALCRHLDRMQYVFELSGDNVPMLNWRLLLVGLHLFQYPLLPLREHIAWGFCVFASVGFLDALADTTTIRTSDLALLLSQLMRNQACRHLVADRLRQAQVLLPTGPLTPANVRQRMHATRVNYRRFQDLVALEPLRVLFEKASDHTVVLEEMATPLYHERVFRKRKKDADRRKIDRLRFFHRTRRLRGAYVGWHDAARVLRRTRAIIIAACRRLTRTKKTHAFARLKRHAIESWAATEIQRMARGLRGRRLAGDQWTLVQAAIKVQGAFRMRSHFLRFTKDVRRRHRAAIHVQRVYRGWLARAVARTTLLAYYYQEMEKLERDREQFHGVVRREMARRIQRLFHRIVVRQRDARAAREAQERLRIEHEMEDVASEATRHVRRHKADVTAKYAALREAHEYKQRRKQLDGIEKAKVIRLRRQQQWDAFKAERLAIRERQKRDAADAHSALQAEWEARIAERVKAKRLFLSQVVDLEEPGEWKALQRQLKALLSEREKELQLKYRQSQVVVAKRDVHERAKIEMIDGQVEQERRTAEAEWLKAEADFFYDRDVQEDERAMAENAEHRKRRDKSAIRVQSAFRMFAARKLLKEEIRLCFVKEFDPKTQLALYRNTFTQERPSARKPFGLDSDDLEFADQWVLITDDIAGQSFFYHPQTLRQQWDPPDECQCCSVCAMANEPATVFATYWNAEEDSYFCKSCYDSRLAQGELNADRYFPYDGSKRGGY